MIPKITELMPRVVIRCEEDLVGQKDCCSCLNSFYFISVLFLLLLVKHMHVCLCGSVCTWLQVSGGTWTLVPLCKKTLFLYSVLLETGPSLQPLEVFLIIIAHILIEIYFWDLCCIKLMHASGLFACLFVFVCGFFSEAGYLYIALTLLKLTV